MTFNALHFRRVRRGGCQEHQHQAVCAGDEAAPGAARQPGQAPSYKGTPGERLIATSWHPVGQRDRKLPAGPDVSSLFLPPSFQTLSSPPFPAIQVRLEASDDIHAASGELKQAARDESARGRISLSTRQAKAGMKKSAVEEEDDAKEADKQEGVAKKIKAKVAKLMSTSAAFVKLAKADRRAAADTKNKADLERQLVSQSMVGVSRDERRVDQVKRSLSKVQAHYLSVKAREAARIATAVKAADAEEARAKAAKRAFKALGLHANHSGKKHK
jgi:hypothetical protein